MIIARNAHASMAHRSLPTEATSRLASMFYYAQIAWLNYRKAQADRRKVAIAAAELAALDDLMLQDMGLSRCGIHAAVTGNL